METAPLITSEEVHRQALVFGWDDAGVTEARIPDENVAAYQRWLSKDYHGDLAYMENELHTSLEEFFHGAKSAIICLSYYKQPNVPFCPSSGVVASYARGRDYHNIHRRRSKKMIRWLEQRSGKTDIAKAFSDSSLILEKALAVQAGLGWFGKNTLLIHRRFGTFVLLSGILTTLDIEKTPNVPQRNRCGSCTRCLDACPTKALVSPFELDARRCLSYHLIESKKDLPQEVIESNPGYIFGCDICQEVCPHNARTPLSDCEEFSEGQGIGAYISPQTLQMLEQHPEKLHGTPLQRRKVTGLQRTARTLFYCQRE